LSRYKIFLHNSISKKILVVSYFGDYLIYLIHESNLFPTKFIVINAKENFNEVGKDVVNLLTEKIDVTTLENILIELRNFGLVQKNDEFFIVAKSNINVSKDGFVDFVTQKLLNYTPNPEDWKYSTAGDFCGMKGLIQLSYS
jgi:hypothetical protein